MKIKYNYPVCIILIVLASVQSFAQLTGKINQELLNKPWKAKWITCPGILGSEYGVYLFRKEIVIDKEIKEFIVHVSADNRYKLYINEKYVCNGSARGDFLKWYFESLDISPYLKNGKNVITAVVWNFSNYRPFAQFSSQTGFILQGNSDYENVVNTDKTWRVFKDSAYTPVPVDVKQYYIIGPGEKIDCKIHPWKWMQTDFDDSNWKIAVELENGMPLRSMREWGNPARYVLQPRVIPLMEEKNQRFSKIRRSDLPDISDQFVKGEKPLIIPANARIKILFDQNYLTNAYPVLTFSNGRKSLIKITYAESMFNEKNEKGNRNEIEHKKIIGNQDIIIADGGNGRTFQTYGGALSGMLKWKLKQKMTL
jgi:alpha-L-rhamnosidase